MTWKKVVNADPGDADHFGGNDTDKISDLFTAVDVDDVDINADWTFRSGKLNIRNPANTFSYNIVAAALAAGRTLNLPLLTGTDTVAVTGLAQTFSNKTLDSTCIISSLPSYTKTFLLYNDAGTYKARNGATGAVDFSGTDAGAVLASIFNSVSVTTPLYIEVAPGDFTVKSWGPTNFRHSNFTIKGAGSGLTNFIVHNDVNDIAAQDRVFAFEANPTQYTSNTLSTNETADSFSVRSTTSTDLVAGCHVIIGSNATLTGSAKTGEHNRVVKIVAGSPNRIILEKHTRYAYNTADAAFIRRVDFLENPHLEGFTIKSNQDFDAQIAFQRFDFVFDAYMNDIQFKDWGVWAPTGGGGFHHCMVHNVAVNSNFENLMFEQSPERGNTDDASVGDSQNIVGYAISTRSGCETVYYKNCNFKGMIRHCFTTTANTATGFYGHPINIWLINCNTATTTEASFDTHVEGDGIHFINCSVVSSRNSGNTDSSQGGDDTDAFNTRCNNVEYTNCYVANQNGQGFSFDAGTSGHRVINCRVKGITFNSDTRALSCGADKVLIDGFVADTTSGRAITIDNAASGIIISNVRCYNNNTGDTSGSPIVIEGTASNIILSNILVDTTVNAGTSAPITTGASTSNISLSNVKCVGGSVNCSLSGTNITVDALTCSGGGLESTAQKFNNYIDHKRISAPGNPATDFGRLYIKQEDANNDSLYMKIKKAGAFTEVKIA